MDKEYDTIVVGGGPAGLAAAVRAQEKGLDTLILENREILGGIPIQCTHPGFGNFYYEENMTGCEFSERLVDKVRSTDIDVLTNAHLEKISLKDDHKELDIVSTEGFFKLKTWTVIYATGARERHRHETDIYGDRISGIYTAGEAQTLMDIHGIMPGKEIVMIGSGDIGLIMARRFALEGADVKGVIEMLPYASGISRNVVQCLHDFDIPLWTQRIVKSIEGKERVEKVVTKKVDEELNPIQGTEKEIGCDTVALATGLIPYTEKLEDIGVEHDTVTKGPMVDEALETSVNGIFTCGNALLINDYVDYASEQGEKAAEGAAEIVLDDLEREESRIQLKKGRNIRTIVPHRISGERDVTLYVRVKKPEPDVSLNLVELDKRIDQTAVTPAEMIKIELRKDELGVLEERLTLEVET